MNKVSIITPSFNSSIFISETIDSVLNQTYKNWELIIIDDCSSDRSVEVIKEYQNKDDRIKLVKLEKNSGPAIARNRGIEEAQGRYIAFLDSDDIWLPQKLEKQIAFMQDKNGALTYTAYQKMSEYGELGGVVNAKPFVTYNDLLKTCLIGCLTAMYDVQKLGKMYMEDVGHEDYTLWLKILKKHPVAYGLNTVLAYYRVRLGSVSGVKRKAAAYQWKIYRDVEKLSLIKSAWYFMHYAYYGFKKYRV